MRLDYEPALKRYITERSCGASGQLDETGPKYPDFRRAGQHAGSADAAVMAVGQWPTGWTGVRKGACGPGSCTMGTGAGWGENAVNATATIPIGGAGNGEQHEGTVQNRRCGDLARRTSLPPNSLSPCFLTSLR